MNSIPKLSVITVVYNAKNALSKTIECVKDQTYRNYIEYIVVDGASTDGTLEVIKENNSFIDKWISEKDNGLYDAMNKGLQMATGEYVLFLNAGDLFYNNTTVEQVFSKEIADIYYGETVIIDKDGNELGYRRLRTPKKLTWKSFRMGMLVCHQSVIIKRDIAGKYNPDYRYTADFDWVLNALKKADVIMNTNIIISKFEAGGYSVKNMKKSNKERFRIMKSHYGLLQTLFFHGIMLFRLAFTYLKVGRMQ
ncbi:glycosyltransferase [Bacteroidales bacterium OttesenSCG-928-C19]|nr:glycosyltransferase [Bacteroidales bacterium OttesenSCG-928-C19]